MSTAALIEQRPSAAVGSSLVILNPHARSGRAARLAEPIRGWLREHESGSTLEVPKSVTQAQSRIGELPRGSRVVLIGGDGTLHRLLPAILQGEHRLGVVAWGSGNDFARAHGLLCKDWRQGLERAFGSSERRIDLGELRCGEHVVPFLSSLAAGFDAAVGVRALSAPRWLAGLPRYLWATVAELAFLQRYRMRVAVNGGPLIDDDVLFASVLNTPCYGSGMPAVPHARTDDGSLDLLLVRGFGRIGALMMLPRLLLAKHLAHPLVSASGFLEMEAASGQAVPLAADGEPMGLWSQWSVRVLPSRLVLLAA